MGVYCYTLRKNYANIDLNMFKQTVFRYGYAFKDTNHPSNKEIRMMGRQQTLGQKAKFFIDTEVTLQGIVDEYFYVYGHGFVSGAALYRSTRLPAWFMEENHHGQKFVGYLKKLGRNRFTIVQTYEEAMKGKRSEIGGN